MPVTGKRVFVCGTRATLEHITKFDHDYRVVCATCGAGGTVAYETERAANKAAVRDSAKACQTCGAH